ncbi:MAG: carbohydrate-binding protein, partial [Bacteroidales bacterium]|nr:carbohydrate-binding protein [Bacteroidales bacterium]
GSRFTGPNHASPVVMLDDSTHWIIHPLYAKGEWRGQGRQGLMNQVRYDASLKPVADYPVNRFFNAPDLPGSGIPWMVPKSDFFTAENMNPEWSFLGHTLENTHSLTDRPGWLRLSPKSGTKGNFISKNDGEHNYSLITKLDFDAKSAYEEAGLQIMRGDENMAIKLYSSVNEHSHHVIVFCFNDTRYEAENTAGNTVWLKINRVNHIITGYFSKNGHKWVQVGQSFDIEAIDSYSDFSSFTGTRQGLYVLGNSAFFDLYIYRDAYTPILAECPANQYGTVPATKTDGIYQLDSIHHNDWVLYAGVEFGNNEYLKVPKEIEINASSGGSGGTVEVWLDSIATGIKVAECAISNTGDWNTFETFKAAVSKVQGRHDVYLRFTGVETGRLFKLKWIQFVSERASE